MARLTWWVAAPLVAAGIVAAAYLPPRGGVRARRAGGPFIRQAIHATPARLRAQALAEEWRAAEGAVSLVERRIQPRAARAVAFADRSWTVELSGIRPVPPAADAMVRAAIDTVWQQLGLRDTKVRVAVVIDLGAVPAAPQRPAATREGPAYLEPDSTDRTTCVALVPAASYWRRLILEEMRGTPAAGARLVPWLKTGLGPCAFYATYGAPSRSVRRWLVARGWDVALALQTDSGVTRGDIFAFDRRFPWYWERIYAYPTATVACLAGRAAGCRAAVLDGMDSPGTDALPRVVQVDRRWWRTQRLVPGARYLSDVAREVGPERFQRFWSTSLPVDTALAAVLKRPVGEWTEQWQRRFAPKIRLGAAAPTGAYALATLLAAIAVLSVTVTASRRQVR